MFRAAVPAFLVLIFVAALVPARAYQASRLDQTIFKLKGLPGIPVPFTRTLEAPGRILLQFSGDRLPDLSYVRIKLDAANAACVGFLDLEIAYQAQAQFMDWTYPLTSSLRGVIEVYAPLLHEIDNAALGIRISEKRADCVASIERVDLRELRGAVLPMIYFVNLEPQNSLLPYRTGFEIAFRTMALMLRPETCETVTRVVRGGQGPFAYDQVGQIPQYLRIRVNDGGDTVSSDHFDIVDPVVLVGDRSWPIDQFELVRSFNTIFDLRRGTNTTGGKLKLAGKVYESGFGLHAISDTTFRVPASIVGQRGMISFSYGIDDQTEGAGSAGLELCRID